MFKLKPLLSNMTIRRKLLIILAVFFLIIALISGIYINQVSSIYSQNFVRTTDINIAQLRHNIVNKFGEWSSSMDALVENKSFYNYMTTAFPSDYAALTHYVENIQPFIINIVRGVSIDDIRVFSNNSTLRISGVTNNPITNLEKSLWYDKKTEDATGLNWIFTNIQKGYFLEKYICCYKVVYYNRFINPDNKLVYSIFVSSDRIYDLLSAETNSGNIVYLLDNKENIVVCSLGEEAGDHIGCRARDVVFTDEASGKNLLDLPNNTTVRYNSEKYMLKTADVSSEKASLNGWRLIYLVQVSQYKREVLLVLITSALICVVCFLISVLLLMMVSNDIVKRMSSLIGELGRVRAGDFNAQITISGHDEISTLEESFNDTVSRLNGLIQEVFDAKNKVIQAELKNQILQNMNREAQIILLQHQMNPHYFFNTLETIRMELIQSKHTELASIVRAFADSVRASMYGAEDMHPLKDELNLINNFILIQKYRFFNRIAFDIDIDESLLDMRIPKLCIQPLLENAVIHGAETVEGQSRIRLDIARQDGVVRIRVYDNGLGIPADKLAELRKIIRADPETAERLLQGRISALRNVHWRIRLIYGSPSGLEIDSREGMFTEAVLTLHKSAGSADAEA